jgi:hypothetical protein
MECIHTALRKMSTTKFAELRNDPDAQSEFYKKSLNIKKVEVIDLCVQEKFIAFNSWVAGIAEAGIDSISIQGEIDQNLAHVPIAEFLFRFMVKIDDKYLHDFFIKIERECVFEGKIHEPSMIANLRILDDMVVLKKHRKGWIFRPDYLKFVMETYPKYMFIPRPIDEVISRDESVIVRRNLAKHPNTPILYPEEYKLLFFDKDNGVRASIARNPQSIKIFPDLYKRLFNDEDVIVKINIIRNTEAMKRFPELFKTLFLDNSQVEDFRGLRYMVKEEIALNEDAPRCFPAEYRNLFTHESYLVRYSLAKNKVAAELFPTEFRSLFKRYIKLRDLNESNNKNYPQLEYYNDNFYQNLRTAEDEWRQTFRLGNGLSKNINATDFKEFKLLFSDKYYRISVFGDELYPIRQSVAENPQAPVKFPEEYKKFFSDENRRVLWSITRNSNAEKLFPKLYRELKEMLEKSKKSKSKEEVPPKPSEPQFPKYSRIEDFLEI